jgi:aspartate/methionine/tyrosine aminotransferase
VRFSGRVPRELESNRLSLAVARHRAEGRPILDLTESNPTRASFSYPPDLLTPLAHARGLAYRPEPLGVAEARSAVAADFARRGRHMNPGRIALTASTSEAYSLLFKVLCDPGDEVLVPQPSYPLFEHLTRLDGVSSIAYRLEYHGRWSVDLSSVERALTPRTRALLVVNPNNPTGNYISRPDLDALARLCGQRDIAVISDEVFADYELQDSRGVARGVLSDRTDVLGFTLGGLSKSIGLPQVKLGWIAVSGGDTIVDAMLARLELACDTYLSVSTPVQLAAREILDRGAEVRRQIQARVRENLARCATLVADRPACTLLHTEGGWSAVIQVPTFEPEEELMLALLAETSVLAHPGYFFDFPRESFVVVSLLTPADTFGEGLSRIVDRFRADSRP